MKPSLLIVDDEPTVRNGLIALVSERSNEWELLEPCSDGRSALETLRAGKVDVLLTDIRMPSFDGLRLTEEALRMFPNIVVIFISGYREFEYAQRAIQFGVTGFIVKPIAEEELFEVLDRARTAVQQRTSLREPNGMGSTSDAMLDALFYEAVRIGGQSEGSRKLGDALDLDRGSYALLCARCPAPVDACNSVFYAAPPAAVELARRGFETAVAARGGVPAARILVFRDILVAVVGGSTPEEAALRSRTLAGLISSYCRRSDCPSPVVGMSHVHRRHEELQNAFLEATAALEQGFYEGKRSLLEFDHKQLSEPRYPEALQDRLVTCLASADREATALCTQDIIETYARAKASPSRMEEHMRLLMARLDERLGSLLLDPDAVRTVIDPLVAVGRFWNFESFSKEFSRRMEQLCEQITHVIDGRLGRAVRRAVRYVEENYPRDLPQEEVARNVGLSPSYFSSCFKRETGKSFVEYLTEYRLEKARKLLTSSNLRTLDVASSVGFRDPKYFARIFKKSVGVTPSRYRKYAVDG